jgi:serine/threonine protein kinase/tetratricopeptide (TPR) repeat protein
MALTIPAPRLDFGGDDGDRDGLGGQPGDSSRLEAVLAGFEAAWRDGRVPSPEAWLAHLDPARPAEATELIYLAFCLAESDGLDPNPDDYLARFAEHREALSRLFELHALADSDDFVPPDPTASLPEAGDEVGPYHLIRELGRGGFARVFLAEQSDLDGRLVVVKVTTRPSPEPRLLARARHAHIVEVLSAATTDDGAMQVVCMPFLGGATLAAIASAAGTRPRPRSGRDLLERLDRASAPEYPTATLPRPARELIARLSYPRAVAWVFARLAEALDHAHRRGVTHGDIKPSNVLLTADGVPMLFDFNLAVDQRDGGPSLAGGTLAYMPPERLRALASAADADGPLDRHRADLYALGLVLVECLTGVGPAIPAPARGSSGAWALASALAEARAGGVSAFPGWDDLPIPAGLRAILAHCLAAEPSARYADGRALAEDLDRWREDHPPATAPDVAPHARAARWARRFRLPIAGGLLTLVAAMTTVAVAGAAFRSTLRDEARAKYGRFLDKDDFGLFGFRPFGSWSPRGGDPADHATRKLNQYGVLDDPAWRRRDDVRSLDEPDRADLELLMLEQVYRLARAWADRPGSEIDWRRALALVEREYAAVPASPLAALRDDLRARLGKPPLSRASTSGGRLPGWVEAYLLGVAAEPLHAREALGQYERAVAERPELLWPRYRAAAAAPRIARYLTAAKHLRAATARRPNNPALHTHLAVMLLLGGQAEEASEECGRALALDPDFAEAYRNRAIIDDRLSRGDLRRADGDRFVLLTRFLGPAQAERLSLQSAAHARLGRPLGEDPRLEQLVRKVASAAATDADVRLVEAATLAATPSRRDEALALLDALLRDHPDHLPARYNRAFLLHEARRPEALAEYQAVVAHPRFEEIYRTQPRAIWAFAVIVDLLIGLGRPDEARPFAERGLAESERTGLYRGEAHYALARTHAAIAEARPDAGGFDLAREQLRAAVGIKPGLAAHYARDRLFAGLRRADPAFLRSAGEAER